MYSIKLLDTIFSYLAMAPLLLPKPTEGFPPAFTALQLIVELLQLLSLLLLLPALPGTSRTLRQTLASLFASPLSTQAWVSLDCLLPPGLESHVIAFYNTLAGVLLPGRWCQAEMGCQQV
jgi:hypothetical protein